MRCFQLVTATTEHCSQPPTIPDAVLDFKYQYEDGERLRLDCPAYYVQEGDQYLTCRGGGWIGKGKCLKIVCSKLTIGNAKPLEQLQLTYKPGARIEYQCLHQSETDRFYITCNQNGNWDNVRGCTATTEHCSQPPSIPDAVLDFKYWYEDGEQLRLDCPAYYVQEGDQYLTCRGGGWIGKGKCLNKGETTDVSTSREEDVSTLLCANSSRYNSEISFPVDPEVRTRWLTQIRRDNFSPRQSTRVCSRHFNTGDFVVTAVGKRELNKGAVPCLFAWNDYSMPAPRLNVWQRRPRCPSPVLAASDTDQEMEVQIAPDRDYSVTPTTSAVADALANKNEALKRKIQELQHQLEASQLQSRFGLQWLAGSDEDIRFYTRFASYKHFQAFWQLVEPAVKTRMVRITSSNAASANSSEPTHLRATYVKDHHSVVSSFYIDGVKFASRICCWRLTLPILYTLFTHDCVATHPGNIILKFADDTAVIGRITGGDEAAYRKEVDSLVAWCTKNNLTLNTDKTKEMIVDMRKERRPHQPLFIRDLEVERVSSFKYLGVHISDDLTWTLNTTYVLKRAQQRLYFLRRLRKFGMSPRILSNFYSCIIESILTSCITVWYGSTTVKDRKRLQRVVKTATKITKMAQPSLQSIYNLRVHRRAASIIKDPTHPQHGLFTLLPSGRSYKLKSMTWRIEGDDKNIKIVGLPERKFLSLAMSPPERGPPRSVLIRFLCYPDKETVLRAALQKRQGELRMDLTEMKQLFSKQYDSKGLISKIYTMLSKQSTCSKPEAIENGIIKEPPWVEDQYARGSTVEYKCSAGYVFENENSARCVGPRWTYPKCIHSMPDSAIQLQTHSVHRGDRTVASGKNKGGGVCVFVNNRWSSDIKTVEKHCSTDLELLMVKCRPFYLPREFSAVFILAVYIPPRANSSTALGLLHDAICKQETAHPDAVFIVAGDFNHCKLRTVFPKYHQHLSFPTRENNILNQVYRTVRGGYKAVAWPHFRQSDHISVFLYPAYRQLLKQAPPNWEVFRTAAVREDCTVDLEEYASGVTSYISTCIETIVPTKRCRTYPNQTPWINCDVRLRARFTAFLSGNAEDYKRTRYDLRRSIRQAKRQYRVKLEGRYTSADSGRMWQGLRHITDYQQRSREVTTSNTTLPDELNECYARFEALNPDRQREVMAEVSTQNSSLAVHSSRMTAWPPRATPVSSWVGMRQAYRPLIRRAKTDRKQVKTWPLGAVSAPQDCFEHTDWEMFREAAMSGDSINLEEYTESGYISISNIDDVTVSKVITSHPNQKPWMTAEVVYRPNRSTDDAITTTLHLALTHLDNKDTYVRMLFIDFSSAFNTIIPQHLIGKLSVLGLNTSLCNWVLGPVADDMSVAGLITKNNETVYREEENLTWTTSSIAKKAQQRLYFLRRLRKAHLPPPILTMFYRGTAESILSSCIIAWFGNCNASDCKSLQRIMRTAEKTTGVSLPSVTDIYTTRCTRKALSIVKDPTHPSHRLFSLLPSGKSVYACLKIHLYGRDLTFYSSLLIHECNTCAFYKLDNGLLHYVPDSSRVYYSCNEGYKTTENTWWGETSCRQGSLVPTPQCISENKCGRFPNIPHGKRSSADSFTLECDLGYKADTSSITCDKGQWKIPEYLV
ncbi:hypothetical protein NFI96_001451 [Prochilodus magdalenae]|nr:hypothetical protein NFI96_001451 [Prochilodus magdalenae]